MVIILVLSFEKGEGKNLWMKLGEHWEGGESIHLNRKFSEYRYHIIQVWLLPGSRYNYATPAVVTL